MNSKFLCTPWKQKKRTEDIKEISRIFLWFVLVILLSLIPTGKKSGFDSSEAVLKHYFPYNQRITEKKIFQYTIYMMEGKIDGQPKFVVVEQTNTDNFIMKDCGDSEVIGLNNTIPPTCPFELGAAMDYKSGRISFRLLPDYSFLIWMGLFTVAVGLERANREVEEEQLIALRAGLKERH
ncbi:hypothetical protein [Anaerolentibacter hominis]|uniref:hypothetical protein n=1 Tax=Anaerolentibacter hominis TaxID=3079009 RepID=UPI0031B8702A